ncbi:hypothetical protein ACFQX7_02220 [Luedemannella flava]
MIAFLGATVYALVHQWWGAAAVSAATAIVPGWIIVEWWRDRRPSAAENE